MDAINEIDVRVARRTEENAIARSASGGGVRGGIIRAEVGFHFDNAAGQDLAPRLPHDDLAQQLARNLPRIAVEKLSRQQRRFQNLSSRCDSPALFFVR